MLRLFRLFNAYRKASEVDRISYKDFAVMLKMPFIQKLNGATQVKPL
jgi:hypothetical protein